MSDVLLVLITAAVLCSIIGPFLVLRQLSMTADALSHSVLLGIVLTFIFVKDYDIRLTIGAAVFGIFTVFSVEFLAKKKLADKDLALGIVFPTFFSLAVIIISKFFRNVHLDVEIVLMGNPLFAPFVRLFGLPKNFVVMSVVLIINIIFISICYTPLKISTFDKEYAMLKNIKIDLLFYALMSLAALNCVTAFESVGAILVISFFVTPAATAILLTKKLINTLVLSVLIGIINAAAGFFLGMYLNVSISGMCCVIGIINSFLVILFRPKGVLYIYFLKWRYRKMAMRLQNDKQQTRLSKSYI